MPQKLPIGLSDFKTLIEEQRYYVDKTLLIQEFWEHASKVILLPRPRRFGKTLNLSMLRAFFERTETNNRSLFEGLAIETHSDVMEHQGKYPVIYLTFKDVKLDTWDGCLNGLRNLIAHEFKRHQEVIAETLTEEERLYFQHISQEISSLEALGRSLLFLMEHLHQATGKKIVVLIDEYDAPIHAGVQYEYYEKIVLFLRNLLSGAFKDNNDLEKGMLTGILRIAKESIFSGLNNLSVHSLLNFEFAPYFGFTETETQQLLRDFGMHKQQEEVRHWYNGYRFGDQTIYNPWSLLQFASRPREEAQAYWLHTSDNAFIKDLITKSKIPLHDALETLLNGGHIESTLNDNVVLSEIQATPQTIWSFLVFSGYLKPVASRRVEEDLVYELKIPNLEVRSFYKHALLHWVQDQMGPQNLSDLLHSLLAEDFKTFGKLLRDSVRENLSFHDTAGKEPERVYHAFVMGLLLNLSPQYHLRSNRESGYGRYDVMLLPQDTSQHGMIFEFKKVDEDDDASPEDALESALKQIQDREYASELRALGVQKIWGIGVVIEGKRVWCKAITL